MSPEITLSKNNVDKNYFDKKYIDKNHIKHHKLDHKVLACKVYLLDSLLFRLLEALRGKRAASLKRNVFFYDYLGVNIQGRKWLPNSGGGK